MKAIRKNITYEFHISAASRKKYKLEENLFTITGDLIVPDLKQQENWQPGLILSKNSRAVIPHLRLPVRLMPWD